MSLCWAATSSLPPSVMMSPAPLLDRTLISNTPQDTFMPRSSSPTISPPHLRQSRSRSATNRLSLPIKYRIANHYTPAAEETDWTPGEHVPIATPERDRSECSASPPPSFAPRGRPMLRVRKRVPPLHIAPPRAAKSAAIPAFASLRDSYSVRSTSSTVSHVFRPLSNQDTPSNPNLDTTADRRKKQRAIGARIDRGDNAKFLEQFRFTIVGSQLLGTHAVLGSNSDTPLDNQVPPGPEIVSAKGSTLMVLGVCAITWFLKLVCRHGLGAFSRKRSGVLMIFVIGVAILLYIHSKRQQLRYLRKRALTGLADFVATSQDFDSTTSAAIALIQEVELVSRGYRISTPLPPVSRLEDRGQTRRCVRLRKALRECFFNVVPQYMENIAVASGRAEQLDLEKYYDVYDITDLDKSDALQGLSIVPDPDDIRLDMGSCASPPDGGAEYESLRSIKIVASRFHTLRKIFLCALLALESDGEESDWARWSPVVESLRTLVITTQTSLVNVRKILDEEESLAVPPTPKIPLTPTREKWRLQLQNLTSLSSGIRGLQAKLCLLREESEKSLKSADADSSVQLVPNLMAQYESIGADLNALMQAWQEGKTALANGIDRCEKRLSSTSLGGMLSPTSWSGPHGLTTVEERRFLHHSRSVSSPGGDRRPGGRTVAEALSALNGESPPPLTFAGSSRADSEPDTELMWEAVAGPRPRPRSMLTRDERIAKMRAERERKEINRMTVEANRGMLRELEMVINLRPKARTIGVTDAANPSPQVF